MNVPTLTGNAEYHIGADRYCLAGGELYASPIYQYVGTRGLDLQNRFDLKSYGIANSRVGWQREKTDVCAFAHNRFDERFEAYRVYYSAR
ncbi:MAG: TonB-dependent receptor, partial [Mesorhizobium sp.]